METSTWKQVVNKINENSALVIEKILEAYGDRVSKLCFIQLGNREEAEDATQEVFLKLYRNINKYNGESEIYTWVYRIIISTFLDILKKRNKFKLEDFIIIFRLYK